MLYSCKIRQTSSWFKVSNDLQVGREIDGQTVRWTNGWIDIHTGKETYRHVCMYTDRQTDKGIEYLTDGWLDKQMERWMDKRTHTDRQIDELMGERTNMHTNRETDRHVHE